ncbi:MAG: precorrin-3B C(17)-methyltransferase, partial [Deltaproteobacteria bacterium]|nr:precorrin-3B C(17)-methyltransferase [Deltaproteobacteria bacterium]
MRGSGDTGREGRAAHRDQEGFRPGDRGSGRITVVGLGPGAKEQMTLAVADALKTVETVVGYRTYLDLVPPEMLAGKAVVGTGMTRELERAQAAIDRALAGEAVAVVSSGDAGVYGMAGLVLDCVEARGLSETVPVEVLPGVPALAAAAALLGAPLMHDFACVSLSDLLTPWETIETRLYAAAQADFVL